MDIIIIGFLLWPVVWLAVFCYACHSLLKWDFRGWRQAFRAAWDSRYDREMLLPGLAFLGFSMALSMAWWLLQTILR